MNSFAIGGDADSCECERKSLGGPPGMRPRHVQENAGTCCCDNRPTEDAGEVVCAVREVVVTPGGNGRRVLWNQGASCSVDEPRTGERKHESGERPLNVLQGPEGPEDTKSHTELVDHEGGVHPISMIPCECVRGTTDQTHRRRREDERERDREVLEQRHCCRPTDRALNCEPQRLRGPAEAPRFQRQTLPPVDWNALCHVSYSALLGRVQRVAAWLSFSLTAASNPLAGRPPDGRVGQARASTPRLPGLAPAEGCSARERPVTG